MMGNRKDHIWAHKGKETQVEEDKVWHSFKFVWQLLITLVMKVYKYIYIQQKFKTNTHSFVHLMFSYMFYTKWNEMATFTYYSEQLFLISQHFH